MVFRVHKLHTRNLRRAQRFLREGNDVFGIRNDVDFFAAQFADDGLHAHAFHAHTGAHGIDVLISAEDSDLGALASFASGGTNLHGAVIDLRDFHFEQALDEHGIGPGDDDLRSFGGAIHSLDHHAKAVAKIVSFQPGLLAFGETRLGAAHIDDDVGAFETLDDAVHELAGAAVIFVKDGIALGLAHFLHDDLFGSLRGDAPKNAGGLGGQQFAANLEMRIHLARVGESHFVFGIGDFVDHSAD